MVYESHAIAYGLLAGISAVGIIVLLLLSYGATDKARQAKTFLAGLGLLWTMVWSGALACGQTWWWRDDGVRILWGRWATLAGLIPVLGMHLAVSIGASKMATKALTLVAAVAGAAPLAMSITASYHYTNGAKDSLILFTVLGAAMSVLFGVAIALSGLGVMMWGRVYNSSKNRGSKSQQDGSAVAVPWWTAIVLGLGAALMFGSFTMFAALGREGYRVYTEETLQTFLVFGATLVMVVLAAFVHVLVNPDGTFIVRFGAFFGGPEMELDDRVVVFGRGDTSEEQASLMASNQTNEGVAVDATNAEYSHGDRMYDVKTGNVFQRVGNEWVATGERHEPSASASGYDADDV